MICPACQHSTDEHHLYGCTEGAEEEIAALRANAAAFDVLSDRIAARDWTIRAANIGGVVLADNRTGEQFYTDTLAEAVKAAMEAEGER